MKKESNISQYTSIFSNIFEKYPNWENMNFKECKEIILDILDKHSDIDSDDIKKIKYTLDNINNKKFLDKYLTNCILYFEGHSVGEYVLLKDNYTKQGKLKKPKQNNVYFTQDTENAIVEYNNTDNEIKKNIIFNNRINYAFFKLAENIIHTFKFYYTDVDKISELKHEVVSFLLSKIHLFNPEKGTKAFSYFGTIAKRYLIIYNQKNYDKLTNKRDLTEVDTDNNITNNLINESTNDVDLSEFLDMYVKYIYINMDDNFKENDKKIAHAILHLINTRENIEIFNKKYIYVLLKEILPDVKSFQITRVIDKLYILYKKLFNQYHNNLCINYRK